MDTPISQVAYQRAHRAAITSLVATLREHFGSDLASLERERARRFAERLDPDLERFREAIAASGEGPEAVAQRRRLARAYGLKLGILEALRLVEREMTDREQELLLAALQRRLEDVQAVRDQQLAVAEARAMAMVSATMGGLAAQTGTLAATASGQAPPSATVDLAIVTQRLDQIQAQVEMFASTVEAQAESERVQDLIAAEVRTALSDALQPFLSIRGTRAEIREQWLAKYRELTPTYDELVTGQWPRPAPAASSAPLTAEGAVVVTSEPSGAEVTINGDYAGTTPTAELRYPVGTSIEVRVSLRGYRDSVREFRLASPNVIRHAVALEPAGEEGGE